MESLNNTYKKFKRDVLSKAEAMAQSEEEHLKRVRNEEISLVTKEIKRNASEEIAKYKEKVFVEINKRVREFMKTEEYEQLLVRKIKEAVRFAGEDEITIYINASDEDKKEWLEEETNAVLTVSSIDFIGGVRAVVHERNVLIDHSFVSRIEEEEEDFSI
jgi:vacuolar-type H+-ATPase subunit E/Vma4